MAVPGSPGTQLFYKSVYAAWSKGDYQRVLELAQQDPALAHIARIAKDIVSAQAVMRNAMQAVIAGSKTPD